MPQGDRFEPVTGTVAEARVAELWEEFKWRIAEYAAYHEREAALEHAYPSRDDFVTDAEWEAAVTRFRAARGLGSIEDDRETVLRPIDAVRVAVAAVPVATLASLRIKAHIACWEPPGGFNPDDPDERVLRSLLDDLLRDGDTAADNSPNPPKG
jgi:hypothetical protein